MGRNFDRENLKLVSPHEERYFAFDRGCGPSSWVDPPEFFETMVNEDL
jgi:hypothetical protein